MNACPDIDVLIELSAGTQAADAAVLEHTASCGRCQADLEALAGFKSVLEEKVPEELVAKVMAGLPDTSPEPEPAMSRPGWSGLLEMGIPFALGTATVAAALALGAPGESGNILDLALFSTAAGLLTSLVEPKVST